MKTAIVHDWLTNLGGAERVVYELHKIFPDAPIYTSVYDKSALPMFDGADVRTTWLQKLPFKFRHQLWTPLRPWAFRRLDLSEYDLVISSSSAESKQVRVGDDAAHVCYCHTPTRYFWVNPEYYKENPGLGPLNFLAPLVMPLFLGPLRRSDYKAAQRVDFFIANSGEVKNRINKFYGRKSAVINPPVEIERFSTSKSNKRAGFIVAGRQIPYKRFDLAVQACSDLGLPLTVVGSGPEHERLVEIAGESVDFVEFATDDQINELFASHDALIFPGLEDFGIVPVEAMASGMPVIAYGEGGILDSVINGKTGYFFERQTVESLKKALKDYKHLKFDRERIKEHAQKFSPERFALEIKEFVAGLEKDKR